MRANPVAAALRSGRSSFGTFVMEFRSPALARIAATAGAEFIVFDQEHSGLGIDELRGILGAAHAASIVPLVRIKTLDHHAISAALDLGALGVMAPMVANADQARALVEASKYPPSGNRGFGILHDDEHDGNVSGYLRHMNHETLVIAQIETVEGVGNAESIAAVEGIDVLWIGQYDLSISLGEPGKFENPPFVEAVKEVVRCAEAHGKAAAVAGDDAEWLASMATMGFRCLCFGHDLTLYRSALRAGLEELRGTLASEVPV